MTDESEIKTPGDEVARDGLLTFAAFGSAVIAVALIAGTNATDIYFPWIVDDPLTAALLGGGFLAGAVLLFFTVNAASWSVSRVASVPMFVVFAGGLYAASADRALISDVEGPVIRIATSGFWIPINGLGAIGGAALFALAGGQPTEKLKTLPIVARLALLAHGLTLAAIGFALLHDPITHAHWIPWHTNTLDARSLGCWALAFGAAEVWAAVDAELPHLRAAMRAQVVFAAAALLALFLFRSHLHEAAHHASGHGVLAVVLIVASTLAIGLTGLALDAMLVPVRVRKDTAQP